MRKKGKASANAVASKVSSTTAQAVLPNFTGHAAASLAPNIANAVPRGSSTKLSDMNGAQLTQPVATNRGENQPPANVNVEDMLRFNLQGDVQHGYGTR